MFENSSVAAQTDVRPNQTEDVTTVTRILHNALDHFSRYGYSGASVREITHASEVTKPTLYYYFKNKEELYTKLSHTCFEEIFTSLSQAVKEGTTTFDKIMNYINEYSRLCKERFAVARFVHMMAMAAERNIPDVGIQEFNQKVMGLIYKVIEDATKNGEIAKEKQPEISYCIISILSTRVSSLLVGPPNISDQTVVENAVKRVLFCSN